MTPSIGYGDSTDPGGGGPAYPGREGLPSATACCVSFGGPCGGPVRRRRGADRRSSPAPVVGLDHLSQHHSHQRGEDDHGQDTQHDEGAARPHQLTPCWQDALRHLSRLRLDDRA
jgi:hypothetical protein